MPRFQICFSFLSPWHMGSGFGEGAHLDALPVKSAAGLPYLPGRSIKGLFREAVLLAEECGQAPAGSTSRLFGSRDDELSRYDSTPGILCFTSATMGNDMELWAAETAGNEQANAKAVQQLFAPLASTCIDADGLAHDKTLRKVEVAVPVELTAYVDCPADAADSSEILRTAARLIRTAGSHRHRGLGRVSVALAEVSP